MAQAFHGAVVEVQLADDEPAVNGKRRPVHGHLVVLGRHLDQAQLDVPDGVVRPVMAEPEAPGLRSGGARHDLVAQADPQQRAAVGDHLARQRDRAGEPRRVAGTGREDHAVDLGRQHHGGRRGRGQDPDARAAPPQAPHYVRLAPEVDDRNQGRGGLGGLVAHIDGSRGRDQAHEVLVLPAGHATGRGDRRHGVRVARRGEDPAQAPVRPQVARQRARVDAGDRRDARVAQERGQLARVLENRRGRVGHDERPEPRTLGLVVPAEPAVVADQRVGHHDNLAGVRRVGADLLVPGLARVDHEVAAGRDSRPERDPGEDSAVLERKEGRPARPDPRIDDQVGVGSRRHGTRSLGGTGRLARDPGRPVQAGRGRRSDPPRPMTACHRGPETKTPPITRRWARRTWFGVRTVPPFRPLRTGTPASRDRPQRMAEG